MKSITIKQVAEEAGVGIGTVSRVLNNSSQVREETRQNVLEVIKRLGYVPQLAARQLPGSRTFAIAIVTPFFTLPSFVERLRGIQDVMQDTDYEIILHSVRSPRHLYSKLQNLFNHKRVDGIILLSPPSLPDSLWEKNLNLPIVVIDGQLSHAYPSIVIDDFHGGQLATRYLIGKGHQKIGFVGDELENIFGFVATKRRFEGFQQSLMEAGLALRPEWYQFGEHGSAFAYELTKKLISLPERPTAIFASSDVEAFGVLSAAFEAGLRVPDDLAIMGFDDIESARYLNLTTVRQPLLESGRLGAEEMLAWLNDKHSAEGREIMLPLEIIERLTA